MHDTGNYSSNMEFPISEPKATVDEELSLAAAELVKQLDLFLAYQTSYEARAEVFGKIVESFAAANPIPSQAASMFNAMLGKIVRPQHHAVFWGDRMLTLDKSAAFLNDEAFARAYASVRGNHVYDSYDPPNTIAWRLNTLVWAARCALKVEGDFVECGVFKGDMCWTIMSVLGQALHDRMFYLYDSFEGLLPSNDEYPGHQNFVEFANKIYQDPEIYETILQRFSGRQNVKIVRGFLPQTLSEVSPARVAFLHLDLNAAEPEVEVMRILFDRIPQGGIIVFDDYGWLACEKQRIEADKFAASRNHAILELPTGQGLLIKN
jgi:O-methyltransferase